MGPPVNDWTPGLWSEMLETLEITAEHGEWSGGTPMTFEYQWKRCDAAGEACADIPSATARTYTPAGADVEHKLRVWIRATNEAGSGEVVSRASTVVRRSAPRFLERATIDGELREGTLLQATTDGLRGSQPIDLDYTWLRCDSNCAPIPGATAQTYTAQPSDVAARLRLKVTASNTEGTAASWSTVSDEVEPADVEGAPKAVKRPALGGVPRVGETVTSTAGTWRGATPITTEIRWQRCDDENETSCVDIPAATGEDYEVAPADAGKSLRSVVDAQNAIGEAAARSIVSPPMRPRFNTAFSLNGTAPLSAVADALRSADISAWISFSYAGEQTGIFDAGAGATIDAVLDRFDSPTNPDGLDLPVTNFTVAGEVEATDLGDLADQIAGTLQIPSIHFGSEPEPQAPAARTAAAQTPPLVDEFLVRARLNAWGHSCRGGDCDDVDEPSDWTENYLAPPRHPDYPRLIETTFTWRHGSQYFADRTANEGHLFAWENDVKLYNGNNFDSPGGFFCLPWDKNDFWIASRDADDKLIETNLPADAGIYWDTAASDSCDVKDLTWGIYHPERLKANTQYSVNVHFDDPGDEANSTFSWTPTLLERQPNLSPNGPQCDFTPWCVNVPPFARVYEDSEMVKRGWDYRLPDCWEYDESWSQERAGPCVFPTLAPGRKRR